MRGFLLCITFLVVVPDLIGQEFSAKDFLFASSLSSKKLENYLSKKKFTPCGTRAQNDTIVNLYRLKEEKSKKKKKKDTLEITRNIELFQIKENFSFTYYTSLKDEFDESLRVLNEMGFFLR